MTENFLNELEWVAVDTETTGLNPWKHEILEIGAVRFTIDKIIDRFQVLIVPSKKQDPRARAIHNITDEEISKHGVQLEEAMQGLYSFVNDSPLIFHNAPFDVAYLNLASKSSSLSLLQNVYYDSLYLSRKYFPERKSHSLESIRAELEIDTGKAHRALSDAEATALLFSDILKNKAKNLNSSQSLQKFLRFHRKLDKFQISLPKNFDEIERYFQSKIRRNESIKVRYRDQEGREHFNIVQPQEIMIFNQKIFIRSKIQFSSDERLIPLHLSTFFDQDLGPINFTSSDENLAEKGREIKKARPKSGHH